MVIYNEMQAKVLIVLNQLPMPKRSAAHICVKVRKSLSHVYNTLKYLVAADVIRKVGVNGGRSSYVVTNAQYIETAKEVLTQNVFQNEVVPSSNG